MGFGLYDAAFAALGRIYGTKARGAITGITLLAGFASSGGVAAHGLGRRRDRLARDLRSAWAALHIVVALPLNYWCLPRPTVTSADRKAMDQPVPIDRDDGPARLRLLGGVDRDCGHGRAFPAHPRRRPARRPAQAIAAGALIGPAQVGGSDAGSEPAARASIRWCRRGSRRSRIRSAPWSADSWPRARAWPPAPSLCCTAAGNGMPHDRARHGAARACSGPINYGYRLGILGMPARFLSAGAPLGFALLIDELGGEVLYGVGCALPVGTASALCLLAAAGRRRHADRRSMPRPTEACTAARLVAIVCAAQVFVQLGAGFWPVLLPELMGRWSLTNSEAGWITSAFYARLHGVGAGAGDADRPHRCQARLSVRRRLHAMAAHFAVRRCWRTASGRRWRARALAGLGWAGTYMTGLKLLADQVDAKMMSRAVTGHRRQHRHFRRGVLHRWASCSPRRSAGGSPSRAPA